MQVGVYVDGYNLYYGGRHQLGKTPGWRWLDLRALATTLVAEQRSWPTGFVEQDAYLKALVAASSVDHVEYGKYVTGIRNRPLAVKGPRPRSAPQVVTSQWPVMVQSTLGSPLPGAVFMVSTLHQEEKGTDVNLATHLLADVMSGSVDAAVVISNDSDLKLPIERARQLVPVGHVNPRGGYFAGDLTGTPSEGAGSHWWRKLGPADFLTHQLPDPAGKYTRPPGW
jgi:uncharacterized LabA/DUF88 family protein